MRSSPATTLSPASPRVRQRPGGGVGPVAVVVLLFVASLVPVWSVAHWPSQDGPAHAYNAAVLLQLDRPAFHRFFRLNAYPVPNWAATSVTVALMEVFRPATADKMIVSGCLAAFYAAAVYAARGLRPAGRFGPLLVLPFAFNLFLFMGFYNFCFGLAGLLFVYGLWARQAGSPPTAGGLLLLAGTGTLLYFCHLVTFAMAGCLLTVSGAATLLAGGAGRVRRAVLPLVALSPPVALSLLFLGRQPLNPNGEGWSTAARAVRLLSWGDMLYKPDGAVSALLTLAFAAATGVVIWDRGRTAGRWWRAGDALAVTAGVAAAAALVTPDVLSGGSYLITRLALIAVLTWGVWLAGQPLPGRAAAALCTLGGVAVVALLWTTTRIVRVEDRFVTDYQSAAALLPDGATFMPLSYASKLNQGPRGRPPFRWVDCMLHAADWSAIDRHAVDVTDYEAWTGYFPTVFQPGLNPLPIVHTMTPGRYERLTGVRPDYVLLWTGGVAPSRDVDREAAADLARDYRLVFRSPHDGYAQVYRRIDPGPPAAVSRAKP